MFFCLCFLSVSSVCFFLSVFSLCVFSLCVVSVCVFSVCFLSACFLSVCFLSVYFLSVCFLSVLSLYVFSVFVFSLCVFCLCFLSVFSLCVFSLCVLSVFSVCVFCLWVFFLRFLCVCFCLCVFCLCFLSVCFLSVCFVFVFSLCVFCLCFPSVCSRSVFSLCFCLCFLSGFAFHRTAKNDTFLSINIDLILQWSGLADELLLADINTIKGWWSATSQLLYFGLSGYPASSLADGCEVFGTGLELIDAFEDGSDHDMLHVCPQPFGGEVRPQPFGREEVDQIAEGCDVGLSSGREGSPMDGCEARSFGCGPRGTSERSEPEKMVNRGCPVFCSCSRCFSESVAFSRHVSDACGLSLGGMQTCDRRNHHEQKHDTTCCGDLLSTFSGKVTLLRTSVSTFLGNPHDTTSQMHQLHRFWPQFFPLLSEISAADDDGQWWLLDSGASSTVMASRFVEVYGGKVR